MRPDDWQAVFIGNGEVLERDEGARRGPRPRRRVDFAGWRGDDDIRRILSTADVCLAPDPPSPLNDVSTMVKIPEYMAIGRPIASYDLPETRISAGGAAAYAQSASPGASGRCVHELLEDPDAAGRWAAEGRRRVERLSWQRSSTELLAAYEHTSDLSVEHRRDAVGGPRVRRCSDNRPGR